MSHIRIRAPRGKVHATSENSEHMGLTFCGRKCAGWAVTDEAPTCWRCLQAAVVRAKP